MEIKVLLCDDHAIFREGLKTLIAADGDMKVSGEASDGLQAVDLARTLKPDVIIMDISMPKLNGVEATRKIMSVCKTVRVIALSMHSDQRFVAEALRAGARGYLLKDSAFNELSAAIKSVCVGKIYLDSTLASSMIEDYIYRMAHSKKSAFSLLSDREREVLQLIAEGRTTKEIAAAMRISVKTAETHRAHIMDKLNINNIAGLTKYAIKEGLASL